ncbi:LLM class flavin-dependent oxidoreductase [Dyadobacter chenwenxiniae]|uniref:Luciferase-like monooxygenase n=1 Tax=Dyadobacter chenwenxiniae TaxID=2906456 RepID=A0A9X1PJM5_9BACT|nr:LLM class flavin-dependent oxidoreductase [Dyadobacter chenwenxiniae]MCF0060723.1 LLM class flavin-dependent oxidoreductase [Dyadobacter chenwenxiniae]UON80557.1 LLM class flavin-dependent oxidoreductase [Dyadobacter chenwenxiniae]
MKNNIKYSILELATVSQGTTVKETLNNTLALAQVAEENGYERYWFAEHHNSDTVASSATAVLIGYVAENTKRIRVGSGGVMLPNHSPLIVAEQFGTLAQLYPNRIDLGLGRATGTDTATAQAIRSDSFKAAHSFPEEIKKIQTYFSPANRSSKVRVSMAEGTDVPIYILGSSTDSAHLAAKKGLPYAFASHFASTHLYNALRIYEQEFQSSEFLSAPYTIAGINIIMADTNEEAEKIFTSLIGMFYGMMTGNMQTVQPPSEMTEEWRQIFNHPSVHQMLRFSFVGDKKTVKKQIIAFLDDTNVDELIAVSTMYATEDRIKSAQLFAEVMKEINVNSRA